MSAHSIKNHQCPKCSHWIHQRQPWQSNSSQNYWPDSHLCFDHCDHHCRSRIQKLGVSHFLHYRWCFIPFGGKNKQWPESRQKAMNLRVIAADGGQLTTYSLLLRWVVLLADLWFTQGVAGIISMVVSEKGQRLVISQQTQWSYQPKKQRKGSLYRLINNPDYEVKYAEAAFYRIRISARCAMCSTTGKMHRLQFIQLAARKVEEVLKIKAQDNDAKFLQR